MSGSEATIRIKLGQIEIDYQGDASFLKRDLLDTVKELLELQKQHPAASASSKAKDDGGADIGEIAQFDHSTDTIANILGAKRGPDLVMAAATHLHFVKRKQTFTRQEIIDEMRAAPAHFNESYINNLSNSLKGLTGKERLRLVSKDTYALSNKEKKAVEAKIAKAD